MEATWADTVNVAAGIAAIIGCVVVVLSTVITAVIVVVKIQGTTVQLREQQKSSSEKLSTSIDALKEEVKQLREWLGETSQRTGKQGESLAAIDAILTHLIATVKDLDERSRERSRGRQS